jgi:hypothetical protein
MDLNFEQVLLLINICITTGGFILVKFNDLKHLAKDFSSMAEKMDEIDAKLDRHEVDIALLKQKTNRKKRNLNK